jgi:asparagine N-glycosylation enzyme membrane subunit Stt3
MVIEGLTMPPDLNAAIATEPLWLQGWIMLLVLANAGAVFFVVTRQDGRLRPRWEAIAIVAGFAAAGVFMTWLYDVVGYVRLLGLAHLLFWTPAYAWVLSRFLRGGLTPAFRHYAVFYLAIAGASLVVDVVDVARYLLGDRQPLHLD